MSPEITTHTVRGPLGHFTLTELRPRRLASFVEALWHFHGTPALPRERVFPDRTFELIVHLGERYRPAGASKADRYPDVCVSGVQPGPLVVEAPHGASTVLGVRLYPAGAYALLAQPLSELAGLTADMVDLVGPAAKELVERCLGAPTAAERLRRAARWIEERVARGPAADPAIAWAAAVIDRHGGAVAIATLRERLGFSKARLTMAFREQIGASPKLYARIVRFRRALAMVAEGTTPLAEIAQTAGYYDQPHFNGEFRELAGLTPGEFRAADRYPLSVSVAESA